jgi:hypothetical protein
VAVVEKKRIDSTRAGKTKGKPGRSFSLPTGVKTMALVAVI